MGLEGISVGSLLLILLIVMLLFGTKRIRSMGEDLGTAIKSFRKGMQEVDKEVKAVKTESDQETTKEK